jgi:hypothetical protein
MATVHVAVHKNDGTLSVLPEVALLEQWSWEVHERDNPKIDKRRSTDG